MKQIIFCCLLIFSCSSENEFSFSDNSNNQSEISLEIVAWNLESGGSDPEILATLFTAFPNVDIWGLSEVEQTWMSHFQEILSDNGKEYHYIIGSSGDYPTNDDRLAIVYDQQRFEILEICELTIITELDHNEQRIPLVAHMRDLQAENKDFLFMINHLQRNEYVREHQITRLTQWIHGELEQPGCSMQISNTPLIAVGDFNLDLNIQEDLENNMGLNTLLTALTWITPEPLANSHCSWPVLLDFVFVAGNAKYWNAKSNIFSETSSAVCGQSLNQSSDHRPVFAMFHYK